MAFLRAEAEEIYLMLPAPTYLYDLYYISLKWISVGDSFIDMEVNRSLNRIRKALVGDLVYSCYRELRHKEQCHQSHDMKTSPISSMKLWAHVRKTGVEVALNDAIHDFSLEWGYLYGGPVWQTIAEQTLNLYKIPRNLSSDILVQCDHCVDLAHNTGNVLNKRFPDIKVFLDQKRNSHEDILKFASRSVRDLFKQL